MTASLTGATPPPGEARAPVDAALRASTAAGGKTSTDVAMAVINDILKSVVSYCGEPHPKTKETPALKAAPASLTDLVLPLSPSENEMWRDTLAARSTELMAANLRVSRMELQCLKGDQWLNDAVINGFSTVLNANRNIKGVAPGRPWVHIFSTHMYPRLTRPSYDFSRVHRWQRRDGVDLAKATTLAIPVHINGNHWAMVAIHTASHTIVLYDSRPTTNKNNGDILRNVRRWYYDALIAVGYAEKAIGETVLNWPLVPS